MLSLGVRTKLGLVAASLLVPLCVLMFFSLSMALDDLAYTKVEIQAVSVSDVLIPVVLQAQKMRTLDLRRLSGDATVLPALADARALLKGDIVALDTRLQADLGYDLQDLWKPIRQSLLNLADGPAPGTVPHSVQAHAAAIEALREFALANGERSGLILDPEARSYHLMDLLVNSLIPVSEATSMVRGLGAGALLRGTSPSGERASILASCTELQRALKEVASKLGALERAGGHAPSTWPQAHSELSRLATYARAIFLEEDLTEDPSVYLERGASAVSQVMALQRGLSQDLNTELSDRKDRTLRRMALQSGAFLGGLLIMGYWLLAFTLSFTDSVKVLSQWVQDIADGNLSGNNRVPGKDELAKMGILMDGMTLRLSSLVSDIRSSASLVDQTGQRVAHGSGLLAVRTEEQANSLRNTVVAISQLNGAVDHNAQAARELDGVTERLCAQADGGSACLNETVQSMEVLQSATQRVSSVIALIQDIAFQTGMLALNAAIEAARAGPAGKGFAIVAGEVRQLSVRCGEAAEEISTLVSTVDEANRVALGKLLEANGAMTGVLEGIKLVSDQLRGISEASTQQSSGLKDVTHSVGNLNEITRDNSSLVEESTTASNALVHRATSLREAVASMKLRMGSADEALALVHQAVAHLDAVPRDQAISDFHRPDGAFIDRDLYIVMLDREGYFVANGSRPDLMGSHFSQVKGLEDGFAEKVWAKVDEGGGWIDYNVVHPITRAVTPKLSYVVDDGHGHLIGCGVFKL